MALAPARLVATILRALAERLAAGPCIPRVPVRLVRLVHVQVLARRVPVVRVDGLVLVPAPERVALRVPVD